jgi:hypothetical protein
MCYLENDWFSSYRGKSMTLELDLIKALAKIGIRVDFHPPQLLAGEVALARNLAYPALNSAMKLLLTCHSTLPIVLAMPINDLPAYFCGLSLVLFHVVLIVLLKGRFCMQCHY